MARVGISATTFACLQAAELSRGIVGNILVKGPPLFTGYDGLPRPHRRLLWTAGLLQVCQGLHSLAVQTCRPAGQLVFSLMGRLAVWSLTCPLFIIQARTDLPFG